MHAIDGGNVSKNVSFKGQERDVRKTSGLRLGIQAVRMESTLRYVRILSTSWLK
jgi:hypothetical protein